jgi:YgiT-type zinc finger domain-containing protein
MPQTPAALCSNCHVGHLSDMRSTYTQWHDGELIVVPNVPAQVCDYCGEIHFHPIVLERLQQLLWADTGRQGPLSSSPRPNRSLDHKPTVSKSDP